MTRTPPPHIEPLLTPSEVADMFRVDSRTVWRWSREGKMPRAVRTLGGHRRYKETDIRALLGEATPGQVPDGS